MVNNQFTKWLTGLKFSEQIPQFKYKTHTTAILLPVARAEVCIGPDPGKKKKSRIVHPFTYILWSI